MGTKNQVSTVQQSVPQWVSDAYQNLIHGAQNTMATHPYQPYTRGFEPDQTTAFQNIGNLAGSSNSAFQNANAAVNSALTPSYQTVSNYMNPYVGNVVNATMANMQEMNAQQQQGVIGNAIAKGAMGGNRVGVAQAELARQQGLANQQTIAGLWNDAYNNALGAAQAQQQTGISGGQALAGIGQNQMNTNLTQAAAQLGAGTQQQQYNYQQFLNQQGFPYQQYSWLSGVINGTGPNAGGTTTQTQPGGNIFSSLLGAGLGIASLFKDGGRVGYAGGGGVYPYANDNKNTVWPGYALIANAMPYSNDNSIGDFMPYIPPDVIDPARANFPELKDFGTDNGTDVLAKYASTLKKGASNVKGWLGFAEGGVVHGMADGGTPPWNGHGLSPAEVNNLYSGIIAPQGGIYQPGPPLMLPSSGSFSDLLANAAGSRGASGSTSLSPASGVMSAAYNGGGGSNASGNVTINNAGARMDPVGPGFGDSGGWLQFDDQFGASNPIGQISRDPNQIGYYTLIGKDQSRLPATPAERAIQNITVHGGATGSAFLGGWGSPGLFPSTTAANNNGVVPLPRARPAVNYGFGPQGGVFSGDPWLQQGGTGSLRTYNATPIRGLVTGPRPAQITVNGGTPAPIYRGPTIGSTGTAQGGRYSYTVTPTGIAKTINPAPVATNDPSYFAGSRQAAAVQAAAPPMQGGGYDAGSAGARSLAAMSAAGYADGGVVSPSHVRYASLDGIIPALSKIGYHWRGRDRSSNIEDRRDTISKMLDSMSTDHFSAGDPSLPSDHFAKVQGFAKGGAPKKDSVADMYAGILNPGDQGGLVGNAGVIVPATDPRVANDPTNALGTIDAVAPLDNSNLGLGYNSTPDDMGMNQPPAAAPVEAFGNIPYDPTAFGNTNSGVVPYTQGNQFMTQPQGGYSQNIGDALRSLSQGNGLNLSPDFRQALLAAGMGMMAGKSPFALQNIGQGGLTGIETWNARQDLERQNALARAQIAQKGQELATTAAQTKANLGLTTAQAGATQYTFTRTPAGIQVTNALDPNDVRFVPWGGILPDGSTANPVQAAQDAQPMLFSTEAPRGPIDPRLMSPDTAPIAIKETDTAIGDARQAQQSALAASQQLTEMQHSLDQLDDAGLMAPGEGFPERVKLAKTINTALAVAGIQPVFDPNQVAAGEDLNKVTTRLGFSLSAGLGSNNAASIVENAISAVPGGANTKQGAQRIINALEAINRRQVDYYNFITQWSAKNNGSVLGADAYFNAHNPPELYALSAYVPMAAMDMLRNNPQLADAFNKKYGGGRNVAKYVLGR